MQNAGLCHPLVGRTLCARLCQASPNYPVEREPKEKYRGRFFEGRGKASRAREFAFGRKGPSGAAVELPSPSSRGCFLVREAHFAAESPSLRAVRAAGERPPTAASPLPQGSVAARPVDAAGGDDRRARLAGRHPLAREQR